jgi:hypothetical protein
MSIESAKSLTEAEIEPLLPVVDVGYAALE